MRPNQQIEQEQHLLSRRTPVNAGDHRTRWRGRVGSGDRSGRSTHAARGSAASTPNSPLQGPRTYSRTRQNY